MPLPVAEAAPAKARTGIIKSIKIFHHRGTESTEEKHLYCYCACGAKNKKTSVSSVSSVSSVPLW